MSKTIVTKNPRLIPPKDMWRVAQVEIKMSLLYYPISVGDIPKETRDTITLCEAIGLADSLNRKRRREKDPPWLIFDDRGVLICNPFDFEPPPKEIHPRDVLRHRRPFHRERR